MTQEATLYAFPNILPNFEIYMISLKINLIYMVFIY
jgi:hypothetical protein